MTPLVSFLLPVRDEAPYLEAALASLSAQTFGDFEAIVVDDGSTDGSAELAEAHARRDGRFRVVRQGRLGLVAALERARREAAGRYLARMDGDDVALPRRLQVQVAALDAEAALAACGGRVEPFPGEHLREGRRRYLEWLNGLTTAEAAARDVFVECPLAHPTLVVRREALDAVGGYRDHGWPEDYDLVLRLWAAGLAFRAVDEPVLRWRDDPGRLQRTHPAYELAAFTRCKVVHLRETLLERFHGVVVWGAGPVGKAFARELVAQGGGLRAFVDVDPRKLGKRVLGAPVVSVGEAGRFRDAFAVGAVAGPGARARIRAEIARQGRRDGVDFVAVA